MILPKLDKFANYVYGFNHKQVKEQIKKFGLTKIKSFSEMYPACHSKYIQHHIIQNNQKTSSLLLVRDDY